MGMQFNYFATNVIPVNSQSEKKEYLRTCLWYFVSSCTPEYQPLPKRFRSFVKDDMRKIDNVSDNLRVPNDFEVTQLSHIGFLVKILYEGNNTFKLRLFYDKNFEEGNLDCLAEPMMEQLTTGPEKIGINVERIDEGLDPIDHPISYKGIKIHYHWALNKKIKDYEESLEDSKWLDEPGAIDKCDEMEGGFEEFRMMQDSREHDKIKLRSYKVTKNYLNRYQRLKAILRGYSDLFKEVRKDFIAQLPPYKEKIKTVGFGTFPYIHNEKMSNSFGALWSVKPNILPFDDVFSMQIGKLSLLDAEIFTKPIEKCEHVVSLFPYTFHIPKMSEFQEELLKDEEMVRAMFAHELGEVILLDEYKSIRYSPILAMVDTAYSDSIHRERVSISKRRHRKIDELLIRLGYGEATQKLVQAYTDRANELGLRTEVC